MGEGEEKSARTLGLEERWRMHYASRRMGGHLTEPEDCMKNAVKK